MPDMASLKESRIKATVFVVLRPAFCFVTSNSSSARLSSIQKERESLMPFFSNCCSSMRYACFSNLSSVLSPPRSLFFAPPVVLVPLSSSTESELSLLADDPPFFVVFALLPRLTWLCDSMAAVSALFFPGSVAAVPPSSLSLSSTSSFSSSDACAALCTAACMLAVLLSVALLEPAAAVVASLLDGGGGEELFTERRSATAPGRRPRRRWP